MLYVIHRIAEYGDLVVYKRGSWHKRERKPGYLVSRESDGRDLEEFRRKADAIRWAKNQGIPSSQAAGMTISQEGYEGNADGVQRGSTGDGGLAGMDSKQGQGAEGVGSLAQDQQDDQKRGGKASGESRTWGNE